MSHFATQPNSKLMRMIEELLNNRIAIRESNSLDQETVVIMSPPTKNWMEQNLLNIVSVMKSGLK